MASTREDKYTQCNGKCVPLLCIRAYEKWRHSHDLFIFVEAPDTQWIGGRVELRAGLNLQANSLAPTGK